MKNVHFLTIPSNYYCHCKICPLSRQARLPFPINQVTSQSIFYLVDVDTWGPYKSPTHNICRYIFTIVDDYSRGTYTYFIATKSNAFSIIQCFLKMAER